MSIVFFGALAGFLIGGARGLVFGALIGYGARLSLYQALFCPVRWRN